VSIESTESLYPESSASSGSFSAPSSAISVVNDPNYATETEETEESSDRHRFSDTESESHIFYRPLIRPRNHRFLTRGNSIYSEKSSYDPVSLTSDENLATISESENEEKSLIGAYQRFLAFPSIWKILIISPVLILMLLVLQISSVSEVKEKSLIQIENFKERRSWFKKHYYEKFEKLKSKNGLIFSAIDHQREDPAQEPLIFLIFSKKIENEHLSFARDLGMVARRQTVVEVTPTQNWSRNDFSTTLRSRFSQDNCVIVNGLNRLNPDSALALYGVADQNTFAAAKNKTLVLLFESDEIHDDWTESDHPRVLENWMKAGNVNVKENRGLISRIANHVLKLDLKSNK